MEGVELASSIACLASHIYDIIKEVKAHKERSMRLAERMNTLVNSLNRAREFAKEEDSKNYREALEQLHLCLKAAETFVYKLKDMNAIVRFWNRGEIKSSFDDYNVQFDQLISSLTLGLQVDAKDKINKIFDKQNKMAEDLVDGLNDFKEFKKVSQTIVRQPVDDLKQINTSALTLLKPIGEGKYGVVYEAIYMAHPVAVKQFKPLRGCQDKLLRDLRNEAENMKKLDSAHVVRLFGICTEPDNFLIVMEYMANRSLRYVLDHPEQFNLSWKDRLEMARDGACGLFRIHCSENTPPMLHRCISSEKFLVNKFMQVKVSDCGFTLTKTSAARHVSSAKKSTVKYIAPEHLKDIHAKYTDRSEVYGYGIVMWEIATSQQPFKGKCRNCYNVTW
ncbi:mixed lineage kinase domain-like protein [Glandiceps talaboti]